MQKDFHYYLTYVLAQDCGYSEAEAEIIAYSSQYVDDCNEKQLLDKEHEFDHCIYAEGWTLRTVITQTFSLRTFTEETQKFVLIPFHFLPGASKNHPIKKHINLYSTVPAPESLVAPTVFQQALESNDLCWLGIALHAIADTFSHQNFSGMKDDWNSVYPWFSPYSVAPNIGHAEVSEQPDHLTDCWTDKRLERPYQLIDNRVRGMTAAQYIFETLFAYRNPGKDAAGAWKGVEPRYREFIYGRASKARKYDYDQRIKTVCDFLGKKLTAFRYDRTLWLTELLGYDKKKKQAVVIHKRGLDDSDFWHFQLAARKQIAAVWKKLAELNL